jgi:hypothetical protein
LLFNWSADTSVRRPFEALRESERERSIYIRVEFNRAFPRLFSQSLKRAGKQDARAPVSSHSLFIVTFSR